MRNREKELTASKSQGWARAEGEVRKKKWGANQNLSPNRYLALGPMRNEIIVEKQRERN